MGEHSPHSDIDDVANVKLRYIHKGVSPFRQVGCLYPPAPPSPPPPTADLSLSFPEGAEGSGEDFRLLPGATGSLCHPLTQTAGSALHTRIIRR